MIRVTDNHAQRLARMAPSRIMPVLGEELVFGAGQIVDYARANINDGAISGPGHIPGPVGGFPNSDTHELEQSLHVGELIETPGQIQTAAIADAPYAAYVELGTSRAGPRPYMEPSSQELRPTVMEALGKRFAEEVNGNG